MRPEAEAWWNKICVHVGKGMAVQHFGVPPTDKFTQACREMVFQGADAYKSDDIKARFDEFLEWVYDDTVSALGEDYFSDSRLSDDFVKEFETYIHCAHMHATNGPIG